MGVDRILPDLLRNDYDPSNDRRLNLLDTSNASPTDVCRADERGASLLWTQSLVRESIFRRAQLAPDVATIEQPSAVPAAMPRAELERRAAHLFERFEDDGFLGVFSQGTSYSEIAADLEGLSVTDVATLRQIYAERYSAQRGGRDLASDIAHELGDSYDRFRALRVVSPERVQTQLYPQTEAGRDPSIIIDPPAAEIVPGTQITYRFNPGHYIASGPPTVRVFSVNDPAAVRSGQVGETSGTRETYEGNFVASAEGRHTIVFEVQYEGQPPTYYTYNQLVRSADAAARSALLRMPGTASDPDLYLTLVEQQITATEERIGTLRTNGGSADEIENLEQLLGQLRETREEVPSKLNDGATARPIPMQAVLIPTETAQPIPLQLYAKPLGNNRWAIVDITNPTDAREYTGSGSTPEEAIRSAWSEFISSNNLPAGQIAATPPRIPPTYERPAGFPETLNFGPQEVWNQHSDGQSDFKTWANGLGWFSLAAAVVGVGLLFVPGGQPFALGAFAAAGVTGAASGGLSIYDRVRYGNFELWSLDTALDLLSIVGGLASAGGAAAGISNLVRAGATTATLADGTVVTLRQADRLGRFVAISTGLDQGSNVAGGVIIAAAYLDQISRINSNPNLTAEQKQQQTQAVLNQAMMFGGIVVVGGGLGGRRLPTGELDNLLRAANFSPDLETLVRNSPGLQRALQEQGPDRLRDLYDNYVARQASLRVQNFEEYVWRNGVPTSVDRVPRPLDQTINNFGLMTTSREVNEAVLSNYNPALLDALRAGNLPPRVESALNDVLNGNYNFTGATDFATARAALSRDINSALGRSIETVADLRRVLGVLEGTNRSGTSGSIGNYFYQTRLAQGDQIREPAFPRDLYVTDPARAADITTRRPDYLLVNGSRTLDIKTGYVSGDFDRDQLLDYNDLVRASNDPANLELQRLLRQRGVQGGLTGHDYLFLPNGAGSAEDAARNAYVKITRELQGDAQRFGVYYLADDGNIYKFIGFDEQGRNLTQLVGPRLPN
ncbi:MAG TPA: hypothetical protein VFX96_08580 [Pyrinomonadaceae bacterium]|nr:hypothetical protein [Pyrinomonadaceae bacterium]